MKSIYNSKDPDAKMVEKVAEGSENAFEQLVAKYEHTILNTIYRYIGNYDEAEDIAQEIFIKVWRNAKNFKGKSKFATWLYRIAVNQCLNYKSKHKERLASLDEVIEEGKVPESLKVEVDFEHRKKLETVRKTIAELPERQRIVLILKFEGKSYKEISQIMEVSLSSVESLIFRAKDNLRKKFLHLRERGEI